MLSTNRAVSYGIGHFSSIPKGKKRSLTYPLQLSMLMSLSQLGLVFVNKCK